MANMFFSSARQRTVKPFSFKLLISFPLSLVMVFIWVMYFSLPKWNVFPFSSPCTPRPEMALNFFTSPSLFFIFFSCA